MVSEHNSLYNRCRILLIQILEHPWGSLPEISMCHVVHDNISYRMRKEQFMPAYTQEQLLLRAKWLLNKLKHPKEPGLPPFFFPDEKNSTRTKKWTGEILGVMSNEGHVMQPRFFQWCLWLNVSGYTGVLETVMKPRIDLLCNGKPWHLQCFSRALHLLTEV